MPRIAHSPLLLVFFFAFFFDSSVQAKHFEEPPQTAAKPEVLDVPVRTKNSNDCLDLAESKKPYAAAMPTPFHYRADVDKNPTCAFLVGGVNSNVCIKKMTTLTGVDLDILERRLRPNRDPGTNYGSSGAPKDRDAWKGANNFQQRVSTSGFLGHKQSLRELLLEDNTTVLDAKLTHQKVAGPLLALIEILKKPHEKPLIFEWKGKRFSVESKHMGGDYKLRDFRKEKEKKEEPPCRCGWIGAGVQGSGFNDELFANDYFVLTDLETKKTLSCDELTPHMIYRYGFYQGDEYRIAPKSVITFFGLEEKAK